MTLPPNWASSPAQTWIVVGQHSKHSFLCSYLMVHLVNVKTQKLAGDFPTELKGTHQKVSNEV